MSIPPISPVNIMSMNAGPSDATSSGTGPKLEEAEPKRTYRNLHEIIEELQRKKAARQAQQGSGSQTQQSQPSSSQNGGTSQKGSTVPRPQVQAGPWWQQLAPGQKKTIPDSKPKKEGPRGGEPFPPRSGPNPTIPVWIGGEKLVHLPGVPSDMVQSEDGEIVLDNATVWVGGRRYYPKWVGARDENKNPIYPGHWELPQIEGIKTYASGHPVKVTNHAQLGDVALITLVAGAVVSVVATAAGGVGLWPTLAAADEDYSQSKSGRKHEAPGSVGYDSHHQCYYLIEPNGEKLIGFDSEEEARNYHLDKVSD
ncbi:MAG: hypothetical protein H7A32_02520 [Deltaproteobacteria bacterium]|nr:hypothetical protein [Deltaproteobacteria bacterium]